MRDGHLVDHKPVPIPKTSYSMAARSMDDEDFRRFEATRLFEITYLSQGLKIRGYLALPPAAEPRMPAIIFNRGGTERGALTPLSATAHLALCASWGYVAVGSQYRGSGGSEGRAEWGGGDVEDAMNLLPLLDSLEYVDSDRLGVIGGSRGGMMALQMLKRTNRFKAAVTFGAPTALSRIAPEAYIRKLMEKYLASGVGVGEEAHMRSAVEWADQLSKTTPLLVLHGAGDRKVDPEHALMMGVALQRARHPYRLVVYENADHILAGRRKESNQLIREWVDRYVKNRAPLPKVGPHGA